VSGSDRSSRQQPHHETLHSLNLTPALNTDPRLDLYRLLENPSAAETINKQTLTEITIMASNANTDDLVPEQTEGYKVGEKKTIDEYHKMGT
jgi:hypothetical protein